MTSVKNDARPRRLCRSAKGDPRPRTISPAALARWHRAAGREAPECVDYTRPRTRGDCRHLPRPCPFVGCRHHLYLDVKPTGAITLRWPHLAPWEIPESCSLDVAECGSRTLDEVGALLNVSQERIRKIELRALDRLRATHGRTLSAHRTWSCRTAARRSGSAPPAPPPSERVPHLREPAGPPHQEAC